jgi:hypothetical protein
MMSRGILSEQLLVFGLKLIVRWRFGVKHLI